MASGTPPFQTWTVTVPVLDLRCGLGEAPYHEPATNTLRFVDIKKRQLHTLGLATTALHTMQLDMPVGVTADIEGVDPQERILVGGKTGVAVLQRRTGDYRVLATWRQARGLDGGDGGDGEGSVSVEAQKEKAREEDRMRSNDGSIDSQGRLWIGTMNDFHVGPPQAEGTLYRFDNDLTLHPVLHPVTIPNGIGWTGTDDTLLFTHSTERVMHAFPYVSDTGCISVSSPSFSSPNFTSTSSSTSSPTHSTTPSTSKIFYKHTGPGEPDGWAMDRTGHIWQAVFGEGRVLKIAPDGKVVGEIRLPTRNVTCPAFVGKDLWITSAVEDEPERYPESARFGGGLFRVNVGVEGVQVGRFRVKEGVEI